MASVYMGKWRYYPTHRAWTYQEQIALFSTEPQSLSDSDILCKMTKLL